MTRGRAPRLGGEGHPLRVGGRVFQEKALKSFLIRHWPAYQNQIRMRIEHVQSEEAVQVGALVEAMRWVENHSDKPLVQRHGEETKQG